MNENFIMVTKCSHVNKYFNVIDPPITKLSKIFILFYISNLIYFILFLFLFFFFWGGGEIFKLWQVLQRNAVLHEHTTRPHCLNIV